MFFFSKSDILQNFTQLFPFDHIYYVKHISRTRTYEKLPRATLSRSKKENLTKKKLLSDGSHVAQEAKVLCYQQICSCAFIALHLADE